MKTYTLGSIVALGLAASLIAAPVASAQISSDGGPVEITADRGELDDLRHQATYLGNVDIIQGDARIRAEKVVINYAPRDTDNQSPAPTQSAARSVGSIRTIEATGEVFYITATEKVKADRGRYDADKDTITLAGNVRITNADGVIAGENLVIDLTQGRYIMVGDGAGGRVRSVFEASEDQTIQ